MWRQPLKTLMFRGLFWSLFAIGGAAVERLPWGVRYPALGEVFLWLLVGALTWSVLDTLGRSTQRISGLPFGLQSMIALMIGQFSATGAWAPATLLSGALVLDLAWHVLGDLLWVREQSSSAKGARNTSMTPSFASPRQDTEGPETRRIDSPAVNKALDPQVPPERLNDLIGMLAEQARFAQALHDSVKNPLASNGILLFGPPGNGKTQLVRATCGSFARPLIHVSHADLATPWVGQSARGLADMFDAAMRHPGVVLFLDEIDAILPDRQRSSHSDPEAGKTANAFLAKVVEARQAGVIIVGATNFMERLDSAAIRDGRFDHKILIPDPDLDTRRALFARFAPRLDEAQRERVSQRFNGYSTARIRAVAERASRDTPATVALDWERMEQALRLVQGSLGQTLDGVPRLSDLVIEDPAGSRLQSILQSLRDTDRLLSMGGAAPCGALFLGPPGTGKTLAARALAKDLSRAFFSSNGFDLARDEGAIDAFFQRGREARPSILFIDEAEDLLVDRALGGRGFLTGKMLSMLDGAQGRTPDVFVICATNHPDHIDPAFLRPGRLSEAIEFQAPKLATLTSLIARRWNTLPAAKDSDLTPEIIAHAWLGLTPAAVMEAFNQAIALAVADRRTHLTLLDVKQARGKLVHGRPEHR